MNPKLTTEEKKAIEFIATVVAIAIIATCAISEIAFPSATVILVAHKPGGGTTTVNAGFAVFETVSLPLCMDPKKSTVLKGKVFCFQKRWKYVTCEKCLRLKPQLLIN